MRFTQLLRSAAPSTLALAAALAAGSCASNTPRDNSAAPVHRTHLDLGPLLGHVGPDEARLWAKAAGRAQLGIRISISSDLDTPRDIAGPRVDGDTDFMGQIAVPKLQPSTRYYYCVLLDGRPAMLPPY